MLNHSRNMIIALLLMISQPTFADSGTLFNVSATGTPSQASIMLCLNGKGPISCQNYKVNALNLTITTTIPNHTYPYAGIKINTAGYSINNTNTDCTFYNNGYCLFSVSNIAYKSISLVANGSLSISPSLLPPALLSNPYSQKITARDGVAPYTYEIVAGALPAGLSLDVLTGLISGIPNTDSTYNFTVRVTDANANIGSKAYSIVVTGPLPLSPSSLPSGLLNTNYSQVVTASGGVNPYTYAVTSGALPTGLSLNATNGIITGIPTTANTFNFTITATDSASNNGSKLYSIQIMTPAPTITSLDRSTGPIVIITGSGFNYVTGSSGVTFNGADASGYTINSDTQITANVPPHTESNTNVDVVVSSDGGSATATNAYTYVPVIFVTSDVFNGALGGFAGADLKCNQDSGKPSSGFSSDYTYKALLNGNNATTSGITYYSTNGTIIIAIATGGNLVGNASLSSAITGSIRTWTGWQSTTTCGTWSSSSILSVGGFGNANVATSSYWQNNTQTCNMTSTLYCVAQ